MFDTVRHLYAPGLGGSFGAEFATYPNWLSQSADNNQYAYGVERAAHCVGYNTYGHATCTRCGDTAYPDAGNSGSNVLELAQTVGQHNWLSPNKARYIPFGPARFADTRSPCDPTTGTPAGYTNVGTNTVRVPIAGRFGTPATATAVVVSIASVYPVANGYVTAYPAGTGVPSTSLINYTPGSVINNSAVVGLNAGAIDVYSLVATNIIVNVTGYFLPAGRSAAGRYVPATPSRLLDTRNGGAAALPAGSYTNIARPAGMPSEAQAIVVNITVTWPNVQGYITGWPAGSAQPGVATLNNDSVNVTKAITAIIPQRSTRITIWTVGWCGRSRSSSERPCHGYNAASPGYT